jgi:hypothetical protein
MNSLKSFILIIKKKKERTKERKKDKIQGLDSFKVEKVMFVKYF